MHIRHPERRLVVVHNPNSTRARSVEKEVFGRLDNESVSYQALSTRYPNTEANIDDIALQLRDGDMVLSAAGDGTVSQVANAVLTSGVSAEVGFLPYGNSNDIASNHMNSKDTVIDLIHARSVDAIPLCVALDGEPWRYALGYMTIGWTAIAASQFNNERSRNILRHAPTSLKIVASLAQLAGSYFRYRGEHLPPFTTTQHSPSDNQLVTDILAINNPRVAQLVRLQKLSYDGTDFGYKEIDMTQFLHNLPFGVRALTSGATLETVESNLSVHFKQPTRGLPVQADGEFSRIDAQSITISKHTEDVLHVLHPKS